MVTRNDVKQVLFILQKEFGNVIPNSENDLTARIDIWFDILKVYSKETLNRAVKEVIATHEFKEVRCAHINLKAKEIDGAKGRSFARKVCDLNKQHCNNEKIVELIEEEYGELGVKMVKENKQALEDLLIINREKFEADLAEIYNNKMWIEKNAEALKRIRCEEQGGLIE